MIDLTDPKTHAWRQGSVVPQDLPGLEIRHMFPQQALSADDLLIIASHDCDVCHWSFDDEPETEIVTARLTSPESSDGNYANGKNPRILEFSLEQKFYRMSIRDRCALDRRLLAEHPEFATRALDGKEVKTFRDWLARRYRRTALPTAFNDRCFAAQKAITQKLKKAGADITAIYLQLDPRDDELPSYEKYRLFVNVAVDPETYEDESRRTRALQAVAAIQQAFAKSDGVELMGAQLVPEDRITLADIQEYVRWDLSDYLSHRTDEPGGLAVD